MTAPAQVDPFAPAVAEVINARIALSGPAGSGKSFTALTIATSLSDRVAVIDTERGKVLEHAKPRGRFEFAHKAPNRFDPMDLVKLLAQAGANEYGTVIIDSLSHYWMGTGGALEFVDNHPRADKFSGGWKAYRPIENAMLDAILAYPGHVIVTLRTKTAYVVETNERGKSEPRKVGLKPEQRDGIDYEFSIVGEMDREHTLTVTKSTCEDLVDARIIKPGRETAEVIARWAGLGVTLPTAIEYRDAALESHATVDVIRGAYFEAQRRNMLGAAIIDEFGEPSSLGELLIRLGKERAADSMVGASA
jgi:hypothetical protein